jgi:hypothetical protein
MLDDSLRFVFPELETRVSDLRLESDSSRCFADLGLDLRLARNDSRLDSRLEIKDSRLT